MQFQAFDSWEAAMKAVESARLAADQQVQPWQENIDVGTFVLSEAEGEPVFSEVLERYPNENVKHYRFCRAYSVFVPEGEYGDIHVSSVLAVINRELFEQARAAGWRIPEEGQI